MSTPYDSIQIFNNDPCGRVQHVHTDTISETIFISPSHELTLDVCRRLCKPKKLRYPVEFISDSTLPLFVIRHGQITYLSCKCHANYGDFFRALSENSTLLFARIYVPHRSRSELAEMLTLLKIYLEQTKSPCAVALYFYQGSDHTLRWYTVGSDSTMLAFYESRISPFSRLENRVRAIREQIHFNTCKYKHQYRVVLI